MNLSDYKEQVGRIPYGKRLPGALYVHREGLAGLEGSLSAVVDQVGARYEISAEFNLVKFRTDELKLSFLSYPEFESDPHPALRHAVAIDLATGKVRHTDYAGNANPPILHRKETFLRTGHPLRAQFEALTRAEEDAGLYEDTTTIGFKLNWEKLLNSKGLEIQGHSLRHCQVSASEPSTLNPQPSTSPRPERHKTALRRNELSKPVKSLLEYRVLRSETSFFDYGCGQGQEVRFVAKCDEQELALAYRVAVPSGRTTGYCGARPHHRWANKMGRKVSFRVSVWGGKHLDELGYYPQVCVVLGG